MCWNLTGKEDIDLHSEVAKPCSAWHSVHVVLGMGCPYCTRGMCCGFAVELSCLNLGSGISRTVDVIFRQGSLCAEWFTWKRKESHFWKWCPVIRCDLSFSILRSGWKLKVAIACLFFKLMNVGVILFHVWGTNVRGKASCIWYYVWFLWPIWTIIWNNPRERFGHREG